MYKRQTKYAPVAQLDRALDSDSKGRWFESSRAYQNVLMKDATPVSYTHLDVYKRQVLHGKCLRRAGLLKAYRMQSAEGAAALSLIHI